MDVLSEVTGAPAPQAITALHYTLDALTYNLRFEPDAQSGGQKLFVAVNGHQAVVPADNLSSKLTKFEAFRQCVEVLHERIHSTSF